MILLYVLINKKPAAIITPASITIKAGFGIKNAVMIPSPNDATVIPMHLQFALMIFPLYFILCKSGDFVTAKLFVLTTKNSCTVRYRDF